MKYFILLMIFCTRTFSNEIEVKLILLPESKQEQIKINKLNSLKQEIEMLRSREVKCGKDEKCRAHFKNILHKDEIEINEIKVRLASDDTWRYGLTKELIQTQVLGSTDFDLAYSCTDSFPKYSYFRFAKLNQVTGFYDETQVNCSRSKDYYAQCEVLDSSYSAIYEKETDNLINITTILPISHYRDLIELWNKTKEKKERKKTLLSLIQIEEDTVIFYPAGGVCTYAGGMHFYKVLGEVTEELELQYLYTKPTK
jgi:hypothetical protein